MAAQTTSDNYWAIFTHYPDTDYTSNGPFNFSQERAYSILKCLLEDKDKIFNKEERTEKRNMWIQQEITGKKLYYNKKNDEYE